MVTAVGHVVTFVRENSQASTSPGSPEPRIGGQDAGTWKAVRNFSFAPLGLTSIPLGTHVLRRGLQSVAALRLERVLFHLVLR